MLYMVQIVEDAANPPQESCQLVNCVELCILLIYRQFVVNLQIEEFKEAGMCFQWFFIFLMRSLFSNIFWCNSLNVPRKRNVIIASTSAWFVTQHFFFFFFCVWMQTTNLTPNRAFIWDYAKNNSPNVPIEWNVIIASTSALFVTQHLCFWVWIQNHELKSTPNRAFIWDYAKQHNLDIC